MGLLDQATEAMGQLWGTQTDVLKMLTHLPELLGDAGQQMHDAGVGADVAADLLTGDLLDLATSAADLLSTVHRQTALFAGIMGDLGDRIGRVPLMGDIASPLTQGLQAIREVSNSLDRVSHQVRDIGTGLSAVGEGLGAMAASMKGSGIALAAVSGHLIQKRTIATTAAAAATNTAAKAARATTRRPAAGEPPTPAATAPAKKATSPAKKAVAKKPVAKKAPAKKAVAKKAPAKPDTPTPDTSSEG